MNKQTPNKSKKVKKSEKKTNKVKKEVSVLKPKREPKPVKIYTTIWMQLVIMKTLNSISLTAEDTRLCQEKVQYPINKLKIDSRSNLHRNQNVDSLLKNEYEEKISKYHQSKSSLPIFQKRKEILNLIEKNTVIIIHGEPQSGKTTQIPQFILDDFIKSGNGSICKIVSTQPDRRNVLTAMEKVSKERTDIFGNATGINYRVRFDRFVSREDGSITFCTSGGLLRRLSYSSYLNQISHLIIDEIQDRNVFTDIMLSFMKQIITKRTDLKLILICSTVYSKKIRKYFNKCETINVSAELYPVAEYFLEDVLMMTDFNKYMSSEHFEKDKLKNERKYPIAITKFVKTYEKSDKTNIFLIAVLLKCIYKKYKEGNILIFLTTLSDVRSLKENIEKDHVLNSKTQIITQVHFEMYTYDNETNSYRKIYLTTNEKFLNNIENIVFVIDSGKIQINFHDAITNIETIQNDWISQKTSKQRKNYAGQLKPGYCFHLFSGDTKLSFDKYSTPEIMNCDLEKIILDIKGLGIENAESFLKSCMTCADIYDTRKAIETLKSNNILNTEEYLTPLGFNVAKLFQKFAIGKMVILGAFFSCLEPILTIAAYFNFRSIFIGKDAETRERKKKLDCYFSDSLLILSLFKEFEKSNEKDFYSRNFIRPIIKDIQNIMQELAGVLFHMELIPSRQYKNKQYNVNSQNTDLIKALLSVALYPNIAVAKNYFYNFESNNFGKISIETIKHRNVLIHPSSVNNGRRFMLTPILIYRTLLQSKDAFIQETTFVTPLQVLFFANDVNYSTENQCSVITVADSLKIYCSNNTSSTIKSVQKQFNDWLEYKLRYPAYVDWKEESCDTSVLRAVLQLFHFEDKDNFSTVVQK